MEGTLTIIDYILLVLMILMSLFVGLYYAFFKKQNTTTDYLHGGKTMHFIPVSLSIISSILSGVTLTSLPTEVYYFGFLFVLNAGVCVIHCAISCYLVMPVFYKLQVTSVYEYLEMRFNRNVKLYSSFLFALQMILYLPLVIYAPSLAIQQVTNINLHVITPIICIVCITYTVLGGIRAVIWTDTLQFFVMFGSVFVVLVMGTISVGGLGNVFSTAYETHRLDVSFSLDPTKRDTFWSVGVGLFAQLFGLYVYGQGNVQKYLTLKTYRDIKRTHLISVIGLMLLNLFCILLGLVILTKYVYCDPFTLKKIEKPDQLVPLFVVDMSAALPGLAGLFVAGVISAGLSTLSAVMNCLAATIYRDFFKTVLPENFVKKNETKFLKVLVLAIGFICFSLIYVFEHLGNLLPLFFSVIGITVGPMTSLFITGMFVPLVNSKGALSGSVVSLLAMCWLVLNAQWYQIKGLYRNPPLPVYTYCNETNVTLPKFYPIVDEVPAIYKISHYYYSAIGLVLAMLVSITISCFTKSDRVVDSDYYSPLVNYLRNKFSKKTIEYNSVENALNIVNDNSVSDNK